MRFEDVCFLFSPFPLGTFFQVVGERGEIKKYARRADDGNREQARSDQEPATKDTESD